MRLSLIVLLTALIAVLVGCSGGGGTPLMPTIPGGDTTEFGEDGNLRMGAMPEAGNFLWGYWQGTIDLASSEIEMIPKRQVEFHANLASILQNHPLGLTYKFKGFDMIEKAVDVDVTITHPYPNSDFRGFDMRGIFMGPGSTITSKTDPGVIYPAFDGTRVLNADGYTRWWNAIEFTTSGMYGYDDKTVMPDFIIPETTLNPYKYFADCLGPQDPVMPNVNSSNRGTFSTEGVPPSVTRRYRIQFPTIGGYMKFVFHYAVDVSWAMPINGHPTPKPIEDFPPEANCPEPFHIEVDTTGSTAFYKDATENGGDVQLALEIFDWQAEQNPLGIDGEIESIWLESETLFDAIYITDVIPQAGSQANSGIYNITIPNVTPAGSEDQEILITVRSSFPNNTYTPPISGPVYPESAILAAYALVEIPVSDIEIPDIRLLSPNGDEILMVGASCTIEWETSQYAEIEKISILLSTNSGAEYDKGLALNIANTGSYIFYNIPETYIGCHNRIKILDADHPSVFDESDSDFTILPQLEDQIIVTVPNGGEEWIAGTSEDIKWVGDPNIPSVAIKLSEDMGQTWPVTIVESTPNADGEFNWGPIPQEHVGSNCRIGIFDANSPSIFDISDNNFIIAEPGIELLTPNGGEVLEVGNAYDITWKASDIINNILIEMSSDSGGTYPNVIIASMPNTGSFTWDPIADWPETFTARIKISDADNPGLYSDESDGDFAFLEREITLSYPDGGQEWRLGFPQTIEWDWTGYVPLVDITMSIDGGDYDNIIDGNVPNVGVFDIGSFFPPGLALDHAVWDDTDKAIRIQVAASDNSSLNDASEGDINVPITLGILDAKNADSVGDTDEDGVMNDTETMLAMMTDDFDSDHDGMYDFSELFSESGWQWEDLIPDQDYDGIIAPLDTDDNQDGTHDGELVDSDNDGVANYLEYYGFTYNWLSGEFLKWDDDDVQGDFTVPYYKTDPMQPSTDQDPYDDGMEVSGLMMDQSVEEPGDIPMIPAMPNIVIRLEGYEVTLNADISDTEGGSETEGKSWTRETHQESSLTEESNWEIGVEAKLGFTFPGFGLDVTGHFNYGGSHSATTTVGSSVATEESQTVEMNWSSTTSTNPTEAAAIKLFLKVYNTGTACASNIIPSFTLMVGNHPVATFEQGNAQINLLAPGGVYPPGEVPWVIDSVDTGAGIESIYLTLQELKAFETGAPISIVLTQMLADVAGMDEFGHWEYIGDWNEYMARVDAVCCHLYIDPGDGNVLSYMVYADDDPSSPTVTVRDAFLWSGAYESGDTILMPYRLPDGAWTEMDLADCKWYVDYNIKNSIPGGLESPPPADFNFMSVELTPDSYIVGKMPPEPPLDNPIIHWCTWNSLDKTVYAFVTDYYAVDEVILTYNAGGGGQETMSYNEALDCYTASLDTLSAGDSINAFNIEGKSAFSYVYEMDTPTGMESYPVITNPRYEISESLTNLSATVSANISDDHNVITEVLLIDAMENIIGPLSYDSVSGKYIYSVEIEPDFQPVGNERIRAFNSYGNSTTLIIPSTEYYYPVKKFNEVGGMIVCPIVGYFFYTWDFDYLPNPTIQYEAVPAKVNDKSDFIAVVNADYDFILAPAFTLKWTLLANWDNGTIPSREYLKMLNDGGYINSQSPYINPYGNAIVMVTSEGRLAYMTYPIDWWHSGVTKMGCYSLYDGPWGG